MLVLRRTVQQTILIGEDIEVVVVSVSGGRVKLGINAPREVSIWRQEVERLPRANRSGAEPAPPTSPPPVDLQPAELNRINLT